MSDKRKRDRRDRKKERGFTLIEIMVVVMIIGMLASLVGVAVIGQWRKAQRKAARVQISNFKAALDAYYLDNGRYPTTEQGLKALVVAPTSSPVPKKYPPEGYLGGQLPLDPWSNEYIYFAPGVQGGPYSIESYGADGMDGGEDDARDIESWTTDD